MRTSWKTSKITKRTRTVIAIEPIHPWKGERKQTKTNKESYCYWAHTSLERREKHAKTNKEFTTKQRGPKPGFWPMARYFYKSLRCSCPKQPVNFDFFGDPKTHPSKTHPKSGVRWVFWDSLPFSPRSSCSAVSYRCQKHVSPPFENVLLLKLREQGNRVLLIVL